MRRLLSMLDLALAASVVVAMVLRVLFSWPHKKKRKTLMVIDGAYSLGELERRRQIPVITNRDLDGFFSHVWTVHPLVGASPQHRPDLSVGPPVEQKVADRHSVIEGHTSYSPELSELWPALNLALAQAQLLSRLLHVVGSEGIGIVQIGDPYYLGLLGMALRLAEGTRLVVRVSGNYDAIYAALGKPAYPRLLRSRKLEKRIERWVLSHTDLVVAVSEDNLRYALNNGAPLEKSFVVPFTNVLHPAHFLPPSSRGGPPRDAPFDGGQIVAMVSRLEPVKYAEDVIAVMREVAKDLPGTRAVVIGDGSQRPELERQAAGESLDICFVGARDQEWIAAVLASASVIVSPFTGRALVEAALSGTPIVAYDTEWQSELIVESETGRLVPCRDAVAMAHAVVELLRDPEAGAELGARCRQRVLSTMGRDRIRDKERELYGGLVASN